MPFKQIRFRITPPSTLQTVWPFVRPDRSSLIVSAVVTLLLTVVEISILLAIRAYVDLITGHPVELHLEWLDATPGLLIGLLLVAAGARGYLLTRQRSLAGRIGERTAARLRARLWQHLEGMPVEKTQRRGSGRLLVRFVTDIRSVQRLVSEVIIRGPQDLIVTLLVLMLLLYLNTRMAIPALLLLPSYALLFWFLNPGLRRQSRAARRRRTRLSVFLNDRIAGIKAVKAHGRGEADAAQVRRMTKDMARRGARVASTAARLQGAAAAVVTVSIALTMALAPAEIAAGRASGGTVVAFVLLLVHLTPMLRRLAQLNRTVQESHVSLSRLHETLSQPAEVGESPTTRRLRVTKGVVRVRRVSFAGKDGGRLLRRVSLRASRGELVAIVGPTGSGKSTLVDLVMRFKEPTSGRIVVDGRRIDNVSLASLRAQIGWVPQEAVIFDGSLRENITYGVRRPPEDARLREVIEVAGLSAAVRRLPAGLDGRVGSGGLGLSHGERHRIALARALIGDPPILLVDELLTGPDAEASQWLADLLQTLAQEKTLIVVTHQRPILRAATRIYVLERGRVVERGTHAELLALGGSYSRLVAGDPEPARPLAVVESLAAVEMQALDRPARPDSVEPSVTVA